MNKRDFKKYIEENIGNLSLERQIKELQKVQNEYIPELINARRKKKKPWVPDDKENYIFCEKCKKYHLKHKWKAKMVIEVRRETTYTDAGYGDDDRIGDVEYMVTYKTCPRCGCTKETRKLYLKTLREWNRREGRK